MKTRMLILAITFCSVQMFASEIIFTSNSSKAFQVVINNYSYSSYNGQIAINNLATGTYHVQIASNPNMWGEFRNISYHTIRVNPYTRTFCEINTFGSSSIAYVEALRPASNIYVTTHLHRPVVHKIVYSKPATHRTVYAKQAQSAKVGHARPEPARSQAVNSRPTQTSRAQASSSRPAPSNSTRSPRTR